MVDILSIMLVSRNGLPVCSIINSKFNLELHYQVLLLIVWLLSGTRTGLYEVIKQIRVLVVDQLNEFKWVLSGFV